MAEFCLKCLNELDGTDYIPCEALLEEDFCEGCGDWRPCVVRLRPKPFLRRLVNWSRGLSRKK